MDKLIHHNSSWCCNTTTKWFPLDTEELYIKNLNDPVAQKKLFEWGWIDAPITYVNNSHGFRTAEFEQKEHFITVGCSFTYGIGLPHDFVWPELLSKHIDLPVYNLAIAGSSIDTCYRVVEHYAPRLNPKFIAVLVPPKTRIEIFLDKEPYIHNPIYRDLYGFGQDNWIKQWYASEINIDLLMQKNIQALAFICKKHNIDLYVYHADDFSDRVPLARDLMHPGKVWHEKIADTLCQSIENKNTYE
jgi:hypothetical protein